MLNLSKVGSITPTEYSKYSYIDRILGGLLKGRVGSSCDVGCGTGILLSVLDGYNIPSKGIDISEESIAIAKTKISSPIISLEKKDIFSLKERYDLVYLSEVLEHIEDDKGLLGYLHNSVVKNNGYLIVTVPAHQRLYSAFDKSVGHHRRYDRKRLRSILIDSGFKPVVMWSYGSILFHFAANVMPTSGAAPAADFKERTIKSSIRNYTGISKYLVSRVNIIHHVFFFLDYIFKDLDMGIEYCVLCKA